MSDELQGRMRNGTRKTSGETKRKKILAGEKKIAENLQGNKDFGTRPDQHGPSPELCRCCLAL